MVFRGYDKLFWDSATKMMLSSLIILISISISIGFPAKTYNIVEEIDHLNCSLTNRFFVEKLRLDTACNLNVADESRYDESTSFGLDLCMAYLELNKDYCKINTNSTHYRSSLFDENTHFIIHDISQYNSTQVDDFLQELNKRVKDVNSFCKHLSDSKTQFEQYRWSKKFFRQISSEGSCELLCGESNSNVKDICSVWLWARTLKVEQAVSETNKNNNSFIDSKQHTFTEVLNPPSRNAAKKDAALSEAPNHVAPSGPSSKLTPPPSLESHPAASNVPTLVTSFSQNGNNAADVAQKLPSSTSSGNNANRIETVDDNRYENVEKGDAEEGRADELKISVDVGEKDAKKADDGGGREQPAEFEDNEPQVAPAKGEVQEQPQSNVMSIKDHNEEAAAAAGQFDSNFNERQPLLTVQDDKQPPVEPNNNNDENAANNNNANNDEFEDGPADEDGDDVNPLDIGAQEPPAKQADVSGGAEQMSVVARGNMDPIGSDETHFYSYFVSMGAILVLLYLMLHYKKKLVALAVEGRRGRGHSSGRRRPNTAAYSKLDSNLEEAMASNMSQASVTHVLY